MKHLLRCHEPTLPSIHSTGNVEEPIRSNYEKEYPDQAAALKEATVKQFPDLIPIEYQATLQQAMFLTNSPEIDHLLIGRPGNMASRTLAITEQDEQIRSTFMAILNRLPDPLEFEYIVQE